LQQMDAQIRRLRTFEALKKRFLRESLNQPLILIFEDLHWIDGETQGFLDMLSKSVASAKLLLLTNYRPEYRHEREQKTYYTQPEDELYRLLASLQRKEFLYEQPAFPEVEYIFKHALTQEVTYNSVLIEHRKIVHEQIARAMEQLYKDNLDEHYSELAHHYHR